MDIVYNGYYEEKRSRFYCLMSHVKSLEEMKQLKKEALNKEKSIKHCVSVVYFIDLNGNLQTNISNSGEPIKVCEKIMLALKKNKIENIAVMISRHYGGTPLGANNLSKAYYNAFDKALGEFLIHEKNN